MRQSKLLFYGKLAEKALEMQERYELEALELMNDPFAGNGAHTGWFMDYKAVRSLAAE